MASKSMAEVAQEGRGRAVALVDSGVLSRPVEPGSGGRGDLRDTPRVRGTPGFAVILSLIFGIYRRSAVGLNECEVDPAVGICRRFDSMASRVFLVRHHPPRALQSP